MSAFVNSGICTLLTRKTQTCASVVWNERTARLEYLDGSPVGADTLTPVPPCIMPPFRNLARERQTGRTVGAKRAAAYHW